VEFFHRRACFPFSSPSLFERSYPPYDMSKLGWLLMLLGKKPTSSFKKSLSSFIPSMKMVLFGLLLVALFRPQWFHAVPYLGAMLPKH
jgi:hypothetical protein